MEGLECITALLGLMSAGDYRFLLFLVAFVILVYLIA